MKIAIVTDSTCDLSPDLAAARGIEVIPLHILWGTRSYSDGVDMTAEMFYERLARDPELPKTSQASPGEFVDGFRQALDKQKADAVVCITLGSRLSGTYASAVAARGLVDFPIEVIDTRMVSLALGFIVLAAVDARDRGGGLEEVSRTAQTAADHSQFIFTLNTLEYLYRGGRIGGARRFIGTALSIKPVLHLKDGEADVLESIRTRRRAVARLVELAARYKDRRPLSLGVVHSGAPELDELSGEMQAVLKPDNFLQTLVCPPIGVHAGPGAIGFAVQYGPS
jgi:DegV family protein with EDD domain